MFLPEAAIFQGGPFESGHRLPTGHAEVVGRSGWWGAIRPGTCSDGVRARRVVERIRRDDPEKRLQQDLVLAGNSLTSIRSASIRQPA